MAWTEALPSGNHRGVYRDLDGKRRSAGSHPTKRAAQKAADAAEADAHRAHVRSPARALATVSEWHERWWRARSIEASTRRADEGRWRKHVEPRWGDIALSDITRFDVKEWAADLAAMGLRPATVERCVSLLSAALSGAVDAEILGANPAARLRLPTPDNQRERYLTRGEGAELMNVLDGQNAAMVAFGLGTGVRWGELAGAAVEHLDLAAGTYRVHQVYDQHAGDLRDHPKGKKRRTVPVPDWVADEIRPLVGTRRRGLLFRGPRSGGPVDYSNWRARVFAPAVRLLELDDVTPHTMRHTFASWLIQEGVPLAEVGRLLGHISWQTTERYAHLLDEMSPAVHSALRDPRARAVRRTAPRALRVVGDDRHSDPM